MLYQIYKLDMYGVGLNLRYNRDELYQTNFGGFITVLIGVLIIVQFILSGLDMINKKNPEIIQTERQVASPERFIIKDNTFNFAIGVQHSYDFSHYIDESVYTIQMNITTMNKIYDEEAQEYKQQWKNRNIPMKPCELDQFKVPGTKDYFQTLAQVKQMYCIANPEDEVFIEGNYDSNQYAFLRMEFRKCRDKPHCKKDTEIDALLQHAFIAMYSSDIVVDAKQLSPFQESGKDAFWKISSDVAKDVEIYFRNIYMQSDEALLFKENTNHRTTRQSYSTESFIFKEDNYFLSLLLRFEKQKETVYYRKYKKIDQLLAEVGGIAKALIIFGFIICFPFNKLNLHENLANHLFIFKRTEIKNQDNKEEEKKDIQSNGITMNFLKTLTPKMNQLTRNLSFRVQQQLQQSRSKRESSINYPQAKEESDKIKERDFASQQNMEQSEIRLPQKSKFNQIYQKVKTQNKGNQKNSKKYSDSQQQISDSEQKSQESSSKMNQNKIMQNQEQIDNKNNFFNEKTDDKLKLTWKQYVKYYFWPWGSVKNIKKQVDTSIDSIYNYVDIIKIIQMQLEFEKVKNLLLNEDQIKLLKFLPKPVIDISENENNDVNFLQKQKTNKRFKRIDLLNEQKMENIGRDAAKAFENIINQKQLSDTDVKLIMMLDDKVLNQMMSNRISQQTQNNQNQQPKFFNLFEFSKKNSLQDNYIQQSSQESLKDQKSENQRDSNIIKFEEPEYELEDSIIDINEVQKQKVTQPQKGNYQQDYQSKQTLPTLPTGLCLDKQATTNKLMSPPNQSFNMIDELNQDSKIQRRVNVPTNSFADVKQMKIVEEKIKSENQNEMRNIYEQNTCQNSSSQNNLNFENIITDIN